MTFQMIVTVSQNAWDIAKELTLRPKKVLFPPDHPGEIHMALAIRDIIFSNLSCIVFDFLCFVSLLVANYIYFFSFDKIFNCNLQLKIIFIFKSIDVKLSYSHKLPKTIT